MGRTSKDEAQLNEVIDRMLKGEDISGVEMSDDTRSAVDFAKHLVSLRDEPAEAFRIELREKLFRQIARQNAAATQPTQKRSFLEWLRSPAVARTAWGLAGAAVVVLVFVGIFSVLSFISRTTGAPAPMATQTSMGSPAATSLPSFTAAASVDLPARNAPANVTFTASTQFSSATGTAIVYKVTAPNVTRQSVADLGARLGFLGEARISTDGKKYTMTTGEDTNTRQLTVWTASGAVEYGYINPERQYPSGDVSGMLSAGSAKKYAFDFLNKAGLLPPGYGDFNSLESSITATPGNGNISQITSSGYWVITFPYKIGNSFATGTGAELKLNVAGSGEITGMVWGWRQLTPTNRISEVSPSTAYQNLAQGKGSIDVPPNAGSLVIDNMQLGYWLNPISEAQSYVLPVYSFTGKSYDKSGRSLETFNGWIEAFPTGK
jgi:hypothetical protein